jgi:hypothetical protein
MHHSYPSNSSILINSKIQSNFCRLIVAADSVNWALTLQYGLQDVEWNDAYDENGNFTSEPPTFEPPRKMKKTKKKAGINSVQGDIVATSTAPLEYKGKRIILILVHRLLSFKDSI